MHSDLPIYYLLKISVLTTPIVLEAWGTMTEVGRPGALSVAHGQRTTPTLSLGLLFGVKYQGD